MKCLFSLFLLSVGYLVFVSASKEKEGVRILGQVIAIVVMLAALAGVACGVMKCAKGVCPMPGKSMMPNCPMSGGSGS